MGMLSIVPERGKVPIPSPKWHRNMAPNLLLHTPSTLLCDHLAPGCPTPYLVICLLQVFTATLTKQALFNSQRFCLTAVQ